MVCVLQGAMILTYVCRDSELNLNYHLKEFLGTRMRGPLNISEHFQNCRKNILRKKGLKMVKFINKQNPSTTGQWR